MNHDAESGDDRRPSSTDEPSTTPQGEGGRERPMLRTMVASFLAWAFIYLVLQGQNGFFAITVDRVDSVLVKLTVLNFPLHLALMLAVFGCAGARSQRFQNLGLALGAVNTLLILSHVVISTVTA